MSETTIAAISATIDRAGLSVEGLTIEMTVGAVATASVNFVYTDKQIKRSLSLDVGAQIAALQRTRLAGVTEPDVTITASDGLGGDLTFKGYLAAPLLTIASDNCVNSFRVLGVDAMLDGLDLSIYKARAPGDRPEGEGGDFGALPGSTNGDVPLLISQITEVLLANKVASFADEPDLATRALLEHQHTINTGPPIEVWRAILGDSEATYTSWEGATTAVPSLAYTMTTRTAAILCQPASGFWQVFNNLMASYQMFYRPNPNGSGKLLRADSKINGSKKTVDISPSQLGLADGSPNIVQVGGVVMSMAAMRDEREENGTAPTIIAQYPTPLRSGYIHKEPPPMWLLNSEGVPVLGTEIDTSAEPGEDNGDANLSLEAYESRKKQTETYAAEVDGAKSKIMSEMCRVMFETLQLEHSSVTATLPLDLKQQPGVRSDFSTASGVSFSGFVHSVKHKIDLAQGKQLDCYTQLLITHVQY
jgi:hypothetical protein